jgi:hypothetical protein
MEPGSSTEPTVLVQIQDGRLVLPQADMNGDGDAYLTVRRLATTHFTGCDVLIKALANAATYHEEKVLGRRQAIYTIVAPHASGAYTTSDEWVWAPIDSLLASISDPAMHRALSAALPRAQHPRTRFPHLVAHLRADQQMRLPRRRRKCSSAMRLHSHAMRSRSNQLSRRWRVECMQICWNRTPMVG